MHDPIDRSCPALSKLRRLRGHPTIVHFGLIDHEAAPRIYDLLLGAGRLPHLELVLVTRGGVASAAWRLALLLQEYTDHLTILVPHRAWSAGTLLCLSAHDLVFGSMAELSPLDPLISAAPDKPIRGEANRSSPPGTTDIGPSVASAEDIRAFHDLAREWFGVDAPESNVQILALLSQRVSPLTLGSFFRADRFVRQIADELLALHTSDAADRTTMVDRLVRGYNAHDHAITRRQARELGMRVTDASLEEELLMWDILRYCQAEIEDREGLSSLVLAEGIHTNGSAA
jgi:hypothetical protein